ncbi:PIN domain-containing protein [Acetobacteroides hydrogenigenes]|uniref:PIN domain-containing protein n=1 Tax=Acetobacteroides hydrogenigenes TaxID=979970 RepID=A0A4V6NLW2_9BACT|nr:hypothetical protein [Acetobacteroides hydrogenigenes]TCN65410.1 hypothetical protein CLV25_11190 [Acetobacteroides hydrogenigenes]
MSNLERVKKYLSGKNIVLDCNIFILLIIGSLGHEHVRKNKRTNIFDVNDYLLLMNIISNSNIITTPNILTEASNLLENYEYSGAKIGLKGISTLINNTIEVYKSSSELIYHESFLKFGLSDTSVFNLCYEKKAVAITIDFPLYGYLSSLSLDVINFNHLRIEL